MECRKGRKHDRKIFSSSRGQWVDVKESAIWTCMIEQTWLVTATMWIKIIFGMAADCYRKYQSILSSTTRRASEQPVRKPDFKEPIDKVTSNRYAEARERAREDLKKETYSPYLTTDQWLPQVSGKKPLFGAEPTASQLSSFPKENQVNCWEIWQTLATRSVDPCRVWIRRRNRSGRTYWEK